MFASNVPFAGETSGAGDDNTYAETNYVNPHAPSTFFSIEYLGSSTTTATSKSYLWARRHARCVHEQRIHREQVKFCRKSCLSTFGANGRRINAQTMIGTPTALGKIQKASGGNSFHSGKMGPLST
jgi:hypothetical protein